MPKLRLVPHGQEVSLKDWTFGYGPFDAQVAEAVEDAIQHSLYDNPPDADLPFMWGQDSDGVRGGEGVSKPDMIYFYLRVFSENNDVGPIYRTTVGELVTDFMCRQTDDDEEDDLVREENRARCEQLRDRLREIADGIDEWLSRPLDKDSQS